MLVHRRRQWASIKSTLVRRFAFAGIRHTYPYGGESFERVRRS